MNGDFVQNLLDFLRLGAGANLPPSAVRFPIPPQTDIFTLGKWNPLQLQLGFAKPYPWLVEGATTPPPSPPKPLTIAEWPGNLPFGQEQLLTLAGGSPVADIWAAQLPQIPQIPPQPPPRELTPVEQWNQLLREATRLRDEQLKQYGLDFGKHPFRSILNLIAAVGQGAGYGMKGQPSPFTQRIEALRDPAYPYGLASMMFQGMMGPVEMAGQMAERAARIKQAEAEIADLPRRRKMEEREIDLREKELAARAAYWESMVAIQKARMDWQNLSALRNAKNVLVRARTTISSSVMAKTEEGKAQIQFLDDELRRIQSQINLLETGGVEGVEEEPEAGEIIDWSQLPTQK